MTRAQPGERSTVGRLRLCSRGPDPLAARLRVQALFGGLSLEPGGLGPEAILCVRSLHDPQPGALAAPGAGPHAARRWEQAVNESIQVLARHAARPIDRSVPADAQAVLFTDHAEWLACLAMDWVGGELTMRWWWQTLLLRRRAPSLAVLEAWREASEHIPAALHHLAGRQQAEPFVQLLGDASARELSVALMQTFGLRELHALFQDFLGWPVPARLVSAADRVRGVPSSTVAVAPPWAARPDTAGAVGVSTMGQLLIGLALTLRRAPYSAHSELFARQVGQWLAQVNPAVWAAPTVSTPVRPDDEAPGLALPTSRQEASASVPASVLPPDEGAGPPAGNTFADALPAVSPVLGSLTRRTGAPYGPGAPDPEPGEPAGRLAISTDFASSLYLINLGLFLGLYGDFTAPLSPGIALPIWDFVAMVAGELNGPAVRNDPIWPLLARLAGRAADGPPGHGFNPPGLASWPAWLSELMVTIRASLCLALAAEAEDLGRFFRARGRVRVTAARLDTFLSLAELPIEIRWSGLDRDPGWVPAAGKIIAFHFD
jgi:hypothetical protein